MEKIETIVNKNKENLVGLSSTIDFARERTKVINHAIKGKEMVRKWIVVFFLFCFYSLTQLIFTEVKNDFLVILTGFGLIFALVYALYKPYLERFKTNAFQELVALLKPRFETSVVAIKDVMEEIEKEGQIFETIYVIDADTDDRVDLNQDLTKVDLAERQIYTHIVKAIDSDEDASLGAAKLCVHNITEIPYHLL